MNTLVYTIFVILGVFGVVGIIGIIAKLATWTTLPWVWVLAPLVVPAVIIFLMWLWATFGVV